MAAIPAHQDLDPPPPAGTPGVCAHNGDPSKDVKSLLEDIDRIVQDHNTSFTNRLHQCIRQHILAADVGVSFKACCAASHSPPAPQEAAESLHLPGELSEKLPTFAQKARIDEGDNSSCHALRFAATGYESQEREPISTTSTSFKPFEDEEASNRNKDENAQKAERKAAQISMRRQQTLATQASETRDGSCQSRLQWLVLHKTFAAMVTTVIMINAAVMGFQVEYESKHRGTSTLPLFAAMKHIFGVFFFAELVLKLFVLRGEFFLGPEWKWNIFDTFIVICGFADAVTDVVQASASSGAGDGLSRQLVMLRVLRAARILKVVRIVRLVRFFRQLRILILSVFSTLRSLMWAMVLLFSIQYIFGLVFTEALNDRLKEDSEAFADNKQLVEYYGSLGRTVYTLFQAMSGGISWGEVANPLGDLGVLYEVMFNVYITFVVFAVMNVVTGIFCQNAIECAAKDEEEVIAEQMDAQGEYVARLQKLFTNLNEYNDGEVTIDDFLNHMENPKVQAYFSAMGLDAADAQTIFRVLDTDNGGSVEMSEFISGCLKIRGPAKRLDIAEMSTRLGTLEKQLLRLSAKDAPIMKRAGTGSS